MNDFSRKLFPNLVPLSAPKPDLRESLDIIAQAVTRANSQTGYKQRVRKQAVELKPDARYRQGQVAALLNVGYDTAGRRMERMKSCIDLGTKTGRYRRRKRILSVTGKDIINYLRNKAVN